MDETGNSTVHVSPKVLRPKGEKQIGCVISGERGVNITMIAAINAIGNHVPPMLIFPRVNFKEHMLKGAPPGSVGSANPSGWSNDKIFLQYLQHFINHVKPTLENKVLLILDNHESHVSFPVIMEAKDNGVIILTLPPQTSHKMQPLDRTVSSPYKTFFNHAANEWMLNNPGKPISIYDMSEIVGKAYPRAFTTQNIIKGFEVTGIYSFNENIFGEHDFLSSFVTDRECPQSLSTSTIAILQPIPYHPSTSTSTEIFLPEAIRLYPKAPPRKNVTCGRKKGKSCILTSTP